MDAKHVKALSNLAFDLVMASIKAGNIISENGKVGAAKGDAQVAYVRAAAPLIADKEKDFPPLWADLERQATAGGMTESSRATLKKEVSRWIDAAKAQPTIFAALPKGLSAQKVSMYVVSRINDTTGKKGSPLITKDAIDAAESAKKAAAEKVKEAARLAAQDAEAPFNLLARAVAKLQAASYADLLPGLVREIETLRGAIIQRDDERKRAADIAAQQPAPVVQTAPAPVVAAPAPAVDQELASLINLFKTSGMDPNAAVAQAVAFIQAKK